MELVVRPITHTRQGLTPAQVVDTVLQSKLQVESEFQNKIRIGLILYVSAGTDDPVVFRKCAKLAITKKDHGDGNGVCGFGVFGEHDIEPESFAYFNETFKLLKSHEVNVVMSAGNSNVGTILHAIHDGGASRISGGFRAHTFPRLMNYMSTYNIPVELGYTDKLKPHTQDIQTFGSTPIRLFSDNGIPVAICSFRLSFNSFNRVNMISDVVRDCQLSTSDALLLLSHGFMHNFQPYAIRKKMHEEFYRDAGSVLCGLGFKYLFKSPYVPVK